MTVLLSYRDAWRLPLCAALIAGCAPGPHAPLRMPCPPPPPAPPPAQPAAAPTARHIPKIAVLPLQDEQLYRKERAALRAQLYAELARRMPDQPFVDLAELDSKLLPVAPNSGARCAYQQVDATSRAQAHGWATTHVMHVLGGRGQPEQLWVDVNQRGSNLVSFAAVFEPKLDRVSRYLMSFSQLVPNPSVGVLGGLGVSDFTVGVKDKGVTLCETQHFGSCKNTSVAWQDAVAKLAGCFAGEDEARERVLVQQGRAGAVCEISNLDDVQGTRGAREACLCAALTASVAMSESPARRVLRVHHQAPDLLGRERPQLRVAEASTNLYGVEEDWHQPRNLQDKGSLPALRRLTLPNLDALAGPLSRCQAAPGTALLAELTLSETGLVSAASVTLSAGATPLSVCVARELKRGAFGCTDNGKPGRLRVVIEWPKWPEKPALRGG